MKIKMQRINQSSNLTFLKTNAVYTIFGLSELKTKYYINIVIRVTNLQRVSFGFQ